jgi:hypothetical protein
MGATLAHQCLLDCRDSELVELNLWLDWAAIVDWVWTWMFDFGPDSDLDYPWLDYIHSAVDWTSCWDRRAFAAAAVASY